MLPGLHGDEAWVGLKAHDYQTQPIDRLSGMTYYTGILQSLVAQLSFKLFGIGVYQLRVPGAIVNFLSLIVIVSTFLYYKFYKEAVLFLSMLAASSLYVISARIAWEVNTFTLFFLAISFSSLIAIYTAVNKKRLLWVCLFWLANIFGSYNHIIYSCIGVAGFLGLLLWAVQRGAILNSKLLVLSGVNVFNVAAIFLLQRYNLNFIYLHLSYLPIYLVVLMFLEVLIYYRFSDTSVTIGFLPLKFNYFFTSILGLTFVFYHGVGFFDVLSQYKFILEAYSYECSLVFQTIFAIGAGLFAFFGARLLVNDLRASPTENTIFAYIVVCYLALLALYTTKNSLRYYLVIYAILCFYMAFKLDRKSRTLKIFIGSQLLTIILINAALLDVFTHDPIAVRAVDFRIGNGQEETSSAFLPKKPILDFLKNNHISKINYMCYPYFVEQPIKFYKLVSPWSESKNDSALIDYDYLKYGSGFLLIKSK
ncbi:hypothetical protein [Mucilaginibacter sp. UR6-11]|uniref:hypothetical protein n=1 Tax=Mucilaginibacter sp. UR6-11 TaxID=1435644 RepID=UPI001E62A6C0|nr:hypothetical protein [Mucilaginibacter sp. UR6-11]MCC8427311.1 hypothetical protein [Mucilaginibacter sp. UR6-11]